MAFLPYLIEDLDMLKNAHIEDPVDSGSGDNQNQVTAYVNSQLSELTGGLSPLMLFMAYQDWIMHLASNPNKQKVLFEKWLDSASRLSAYNLKSMDSSCGPCVDPPEYDHRFAHSSWSTWPFNMVSQSFLMGERWWDEASKDLRGVSHHHQDVVRFMNRQLLDASSPSNFILTNPEVLNLTLKSGGMNLWMGLQNLVDREERRKSKKPPFGGEAFEVGKRVAITPGKVIYRNRLIELIQYEPTTKQVHPEPILIMPAWIMKYYILDLSPANSLIKYLVDKGHTVFAISWLNPDSEDRDLNLNNYAEFGVMDSLKAINAIVPDQKVHIVGYCIAGTLLSAIAAAMGGNDDHRLASMTLFASQTDFSEVGELSIFIDDAEISFIEDIMSEKGYLDSKHMNGAFQLLNSSDLLWSRILKNYMMGEKQPVNDLAAWNADGTRLPYQMHSETLRHFFLNNDLASGKYHLESKSVNLMDIDCPIYCVATTKDHISPWQSVHKLHTLTDAEIEFVLTSGGHNSGIINPPNVKTSEFKSLVRSKCGHYYYPEQWLQRASSHEGSWWPHWSKWLKDRSGPNTKPPAMGAMGYPPLCDAPGTYVLKK